MLLIKIKQQDLLPDGKNISDSIAYLREYTGCLKKFARIRRTQNPCSGFIYLMFRVLAHLY